MSVENKNLIIYNTADGKASVSLYAKDGMVWMNQNQLSELFDTSKQNIGQHIASILKENELDANSVVKNYFTTASDGKEYHVATYSPSAAIMMLPINPLKCFLPKLKINCYLQ
jgi:hypothetical protein